MLVLERGIYEEVVIRCGGEVIKIKLLNARTGYARLGFIAGKAVSIDRAEIDARKQAEKGAS
jgi:carbon storage regulator CsrA